MSNTHEALVVRIGEITTHPNADKLELTMINGYQMIVGKGSFKTGDLAVFIQPDSIVPQTEPFKFIWGQYAAEQLGIPGVPTERPYDKTWEYQTVVPEHRRRIKPKRLRKEWSEGLLMPLNEVIGPYTNPGQEFVEGQDVAKHIGITHYVPEFDKLQTASESGATPRRKYPRSLKGWFFFLLHRLGFRHAGGQSYAQEVSFNLPEYDVDALKQSRVKFAQGENVLVTEKIHGSNARYTVQDGVFYAGSHYQWKVDGPNVFWNAVKQNPEIRDWCLANPGKVLFGEVGPTQKGFRYGAEEGKTWFYAFGVYDPETQTYDWPGDHGFAPTVPIIFSGQYDMFNVKAMVDGKSLVFKSDNIREGIVIHSRDRQLKLKVVSNAYLEKN